jgi:Domain of unknown function (DUF4402)
MSTSSSNALHVHHASFKHVLPFAMLCLMANVMSALPAWATPTINVTKVSELSFGKLVPGGSVGYVAMSPGGVRTPSGAVILFQQGGGGGNAASFLVTVSGGVPSSACTVLTPVNSFVYLTGSGADMVINNFNPTSASITLDGSGGASATIYVGGTLSIGGAQAPGSYSSSFTLSVTCP